MRLRGEGTLYQGKAPNGRIRWIAEITFVEDGRRRRVRGTGNTPQEAVERRLRHLQDFLNGTHTRAPQTRLSAVLEHYRAFNENRLVPDTMERTIKVIENHIIKVIGDIPIEELTADDINECIDKAKESGKSVPRNVRKAIGIIIRFSIKQKIITDNLMDRVKSAPYRAAVKDTDEEQIDDRTEKYIDLLSTLRAAAEEKPTYETALNFGRILFLSLGLRRGELCGIEWSSFDEDRTTLTINREAKTGPARIERRTKNNKPRAIPLEPLYQEAIRWIEEERPERDTDEWWKDQVFVSIGAQGQEKGTTPQKLYDYWTATLRDFMSEWQPRFKMDAIVDGEPYPYPMKHLATLSDKEFRATEWYFRPHFVRHITASTLSKAGIPVSTAQSILGHMDPEQTEQYTHTYEKAKQEGIKAITNAIIK